MMTAKIEDYALLSDCRRAALVSKTGSIDWLCLPRFDSGACFAALLGDEENGQWKFSPTAEKFDVRRKYRTDSMVLETEFITETGKVRVTDALIVGEESPLLVRLIQGLEGEVEMDCLLRLRLDYGSIVPWVRRTEYGLWAVAGPDEIHIQSPIRLVGLPELKSVARFNVAAEDHLEFSLSWNPYFKADYQVQTDLAGKVHATDHYWKTYAARCRYKGEHQEAVVRSVLTLKGLTYEPTGGIVAAPTTSLPETLGGERNWDYRYCWIRDSTFSMYALLTAGYTEEARAWRRWLVRTVAGTPAQVNIMYGLAGERRLTEVNLEWLRGYEKSRPVRIGNAAYQQLQLDVFGEALDTLYLSLKSGIPMEENSWRVQECFLDFLEKNWNTPDAGIWEVRGPSQHFVHSKVMTWVAVDRAIRSAELAKVEAPLERWKALRETIHRDVCEKGIDPRRGCFTQAYGTASLDASLLMIPLVGFLPPEDPRVKSTVAAVEEELFVDGFVLRYKTEEMKDVLHGREGSFLACSFWLADCWILLGELERAEKLFRRLISLANELGLLSEEYDSKAGRLVGNFPQALTHIALINTAFNLERAMDGSPVKDRSSC